MARALFGFARPPIADQSMRLLDGNEQAQILSLWKDWNAKFGTAILLIIHNVILRAGGK
ncbi:MAG: hypothetical protein JST79_15640 [Acidobacteria bacterium]|nr:hypothetical protein [Acidobacteriota bacterium]